MLFFQTILCRKGKGRNYDENAVSVPTGDEDGGIGGLINGVDGLPSGFTGLNESAAMAIFAQSQLGTYLSALSSRMTMLTNISSQVLT